MTDVQHKVIAELKAAAALRHGDSIGLSSDGRGVAVLAAGDGGQAPGEVLEEYLWNSAGNMLIRICYIVWEHVLGEDHPWGRFNTERQAEQRIASLFSPGSAARGEYYIARLYTTNPLD